MIPSKTQTLDELLSQKEIFFAGDELWRWIDARCSIMDVSKTERNRIKNKIVTDILAASRKAFVTIAYTTQTIRQVDSRIREVTDFTCYPIIKNNTICHLRFFVGTRASATYLDKDVRFYCEPFFAMFNTYERIQPLEEGYLSQETYIPIKENPAWIKYLKDNGYSDEEIFKKSLEMESLLKQGKKT